MIRQCNNETVSHFAIMWPILYCAHCFNVHAVKVSTIFYRYIIPIHQRSLLTLPIYTQIILGTYAIITMLLLDISFFVGTFLGRLLSCAKNVWCDKLQSIKNENIIITDKCAMLIFVGLCSVLFDWWGKKRSYSACCIIDTIQLYWPWFGRANKFSDWSALHINPGHYLYTQ